MARESRPGRETSPPGDAWEAFRRLDAVPRLLIMGAGHIAQALVPMAARAGFCTAVIDRRPQLATKARFPDAAGVACDSFRAAYARLGAARPGWGGGEVQPWPDTDYGLLAAMAVGTAESGAPVAMATVVSSAGSTPRGAGARMLVAAGGRPDVGSIGGGPVEAAALRAAWDLAAAGGDVDL